MQYVQRRLQRSVKEIRKYLWCRPCRSSRGEGFCRGGCTDGCVLDPTARMKVGGLPPPSPFLSSDSRGPLSRIIGADDREMPLKRRLPASLSSRRRNSFRRGRVARVRRGRHTRLRLVQLGPHLHMGRMEAATTCDKAAGISSMREKPRINKKLVSQKGELSTSKVENPTSVV